jgi:uncharacterized protein (TIGR02246 family)
MRRALVMLVVCAVPLVARAADGGAKAGIEAGLKKFSEAVAKGDAAALAKLYAVDGEILPPGRPIQKGREAIEKEFAGLVKDFKKISFTTYEVHAMGNLALEVSGWKLEDASGKGPEGKGLVLWKKNGKTWELYRDIWNSNSPPEPPKAAAAPTAPAPAASPAAK